MSGFLRKIFRRRVANNHQTGAHGGSVAPTSSTGTSSAPGSSTAASSSAPSTRVPAVLSWTSVQNSSGPASAIPGLFDDSINEIAKLVKRDTFPRFVMDKLGSNYQDIDGTEKLKAAFRTRPDFVRAFLQYTAGESSIENVLFLAASLQAGENSIEDQTLIFNTFVVDNAGRQINLPYDMKNAIYNALGVPIPSADDFNMASYGW